MLGLGLGARVCLSQSSQAPEGYGKYPCDETDGPKSRLFPNGKLQVQWACQEGRVLGRVKHYNDQGTLVREVDYKDGVLNGWERIYSKEDSKLLYEVEYKNGLRKGQLRTYDNGLLKVEARVNGLNYEGIVKRYHLNGKLMSEGLYRDGDKTGVPYALVLTLSNYPVRIIQRTRLNPLDNFRTSNYMLSF